MKHTNVRILVAGILLWANVSCKDHGPPTPVFNITLRFVGPMSAAQQALFIHAAARLEKIITADIVDAAAPADSLLEGCQLPQGTHIAESIDDLVIFASIDSIDGPGKILAEAGPCLYRNIAQGQDTILIPAVGKMQFDADDIATLTGAGSLEEVVTHEMIHVLGFGTLWDKGLLLDTGTANPRYTGVQGRIGCIEVGGTTTCQSTVPVEATGGAGTANGHWREATFGTELMTGFINRSPNPLSVMTIRSLADLGYAVDASAADPYTIPGAMFRTGSDTSSPVTPAGWERPLPIKFFFVLDHGTVRKVMRR